MQKKQGQTVLDKFDLCVVAGVGRKSHDLRVILASLVLRRSSDELPFCFPSRVINYLIVVGLQPTPPDTFG